VGHGSKPHQDLAPVLAERLSRTQAEWHAGPAAAQSRTCGGVGTRSNGLAPGPA
jgi:hypothetical protein